MGFPESPGEGKAEAVDFAQGKGFPGCQKDKRNLRKAEFWLPDVNGPDSGARKTAKRIPRVTQDVLGIWGV